MINRQGRKIGQGRPLLLESVLAAQRIFQSPPPPPMGLRNSHY